ncbi:hypothetical protein DFH09DRAFT_1074904 [Mycena vulgaris]|nr:hypothetical protein DFH09DRAFT_1074904 [Mycena vulgaris]
MKLFAAEPVHGQGALSSQISDTQYFAQCRLMMSMFLLFLPLPLKTTRLGTLHPVKTNMRTLKDGDLLGGISQPIDDEGWKRWGWERHSPEAADGLPRDTSPSPPGSLTPIKLEPDSVALFQDIQYDTLSPFEKSVIRLVRDSKREGGSFSRWLKGRQKRIEYLEGREAHHLRLLAEIHLLSKNLD